MPTFTITSRSASTMPNGSTMPNSNSDDQFYFGDGVTALVNDEPNQAEFDLAARDTGQSDGELEGSITWLAPDMETVLGLVELNVSVDDWII